MDKIAGFYPPALARMSTQPDTVGMARATWNGAVVAESNDVEIVENNVYFPAEAVNRAYLKPSAHHTACGWKGTASYYSLEVNGSTNVDAAWYYPEPKEAAKNIRDRIAFWKGVTVER